MPNPEPPFRRVQKATNLGLSHFAKCLPILLRAGLLLLFTWYGLELYLIASTLAQIVLAVIVISLLLTFSAVMLFTYKKYPWENDDSVPSAASPLWPFLLINVLMILLVCAILKWEQGRGLQEGTHGLLGFTWYWVQKIGLLFTGGR
jgi:cobalamin synthase